VYHSLPPSFPISTLSTDFRRRVRRTLASSSVRPLSHLGDDVQHNLRRYFDVTLFAANLQAAHCQACSTSPGLFATYSRYSALKDELRKAVE